MPHLPASLQRSPLSLSVNVDHIATLRQARRTAYPDPVEAALIAEQGYKWSAKLGGRGEGRRCVLPADAPPHAHQPG